MAQALSQIGLDARQMREILRLAVALIEPRENAQYLRRALRGENRIGLGESRHIEACVGFTAQLGVMGEQLQLQIVGHRDAGVLPERGHVVGRVAQHAVLEVDNADARDPFALRQPQ